MTPEVAIAYLLRHAAGRIPRDRARLVAKTFGQSLGTLGHAVGEGDPVVVPELACALARIPVTIPEHLLRAISMYNTERATQHLGTLVGVPPESRSQIARAATDRA